MKTQAWGWLAAGVVALGLNGFYQDGGAQWAHQIVDRVSRDTQAVIALATGRADEFFAEARLASAQHETESCRWQASMARVQARMARTQAEFNVMSARRQAQLDRFQAQRDRMAAQIVRMRVPAMTFNPAEVTVPNVDCPRVRIRVPHRPAVRIPAPPVIRVETSRPDML